MYSLTIRIKKFTNCIKGVLDMMFSLEELEMVKCIRDLLGDDTIDECDCIETYIEILGE